MLTEAEQRELSVITVDGKEYLGVVKKEGTNIVIKDAMGLSEGLQSKNLKGYIKRKNLGVLKDYTFRGNGSLTERKFTPEEAAQLANFCALFLLAKGSAMKTLENNEFDRLLSE